MESYIYITVPSRARSHIFLNVRLRHGPVNFDFLDTGERHNLKTKKDNLVVFTIIRLNSDEFKWVRAA